MGNAKDNQCNKPHGGNSLRAVWTGLRIITFKYAGISNVASLASFIAAGVQNKERQSAGNEPGPTAQARFLHFVSLYSSFRSPVRTIWVRRFVERLLCGFLRAIRYCNLRCLASMNSF